MSVSPAPPGTNFFQYPPLGVADSSRVNEFVIDELNLQRPETSPFAIFVSIPYCRVRCHSCPYFKDLLPARNAAAHFDHLLSGLESEVGIYSTSARFRQSRAAAVFVGGGTGSVLEPATLGRLLTKIRAGFNIHRSTEITLEGNPRDFTAPYVNEVLNAGVNRISVGLQGFTDKKLREGLNSPHRSVDSNKVVGTITSSGVRSANFDLLYRTPGQTLEEWRRDVEILAAYEPASIKLYEYVVYPGSPAEALSTGLRLAPRIERTEAYDWYLWAKDFLEKLGYREHRFGSFCRQGHKQRYGHVAYDQGRELIGLGPGAYSFVNGYQFANHWHTEDYLGALKQGQMLPISHISPKATPLNLMERFAIFSLMSGAINCRAFHLKFDRPFASVFGQQVEDLKASGLAIEASGRIVLTQQGQTNRRAAMFTFFGPTFRSAN